MQVPRTPSRRTSLFVAIIILLGLGGGAMAQAAPLRAPDVGCFAQELVQQGYREFIVNNRFGDEGEGAELIPTLMTPAQLRSRLPEPTTDQVSRAATLIGGQLYVLDKATEAGPCTLSTTFYRMNVTTGVTEKLAEASQTADVRTGRVQTTATAGDGRTATDTGVFAGPCQACAVGNVVTSILAPFLCGPAAAWVCGAALTLSTLNGVSCGVVNCQDESQPGMAAGALSCGFSDCSIYSMVYSGPNRSVSSVCDSIQWIYPPGAAAIHNGSLSTQVGDDACSGGRTGVLLAGNEEYRYTHYASDPQWTACAIRVMYSVTAQFSDWSFLSTGWTPHNKLAVEGTCPGWRTVP